MDQKERQPMGPSPKAFSENIINFGQVNKTCAFVGGKLIE